MIYAMSDLHGCYDLYIKMLEKIKFSDKDTLYILGDIVDRGPDGIKILQDIQKRHNVFPLRGNHDYSALRIFQKIRYSREINDFIPECIMWKLIGGEPTYKAFIALSEDEQIKIISGLTNSLIYDELEVNGKKFHLSHSVPNKKTMLAHANGHVPYTDYLAGAPEYDKIYFEDKYIVTGHTPTIFIDPEYDGKIYIKNNHIAIDCGAVFGRILGCICLNDFKEYYVKDDCNN